MLFSPSNYEFSIHWMIPLLARWIIYYSLGSKHPLPCGPLSLFLPFSNDGSTFGLAPI